MTRTGCGSHGSIPAAAPPAQGLGCRCWPRRFGRGSRCLEDPALMNGVSARSNSPAAADGGAPGDLPGPLAERGLAGPGCLTRRGNARGWRVSWTRMRMPVLSGASCPAVILSRGSLDDAVQRNPGEPGLHSVSNAAPAADRRRSGRSAGPGYPPAHRGARAGFAFGAPKTDAGRRIVAIPEVLIPGLRGHLACFVAQG
jgi:hypothetical protein